jgi:ATP-dependent Clp endopeptidase proteolytic subunit ClpP
MTAKDAPTLLEPVEVAWFEAEADKYTAEAEAARALAAKDLAETRKIELETVKSHYDAEREHEKRKDELTAHKYHHVYLFKGTVEDTSVAKCMDQLTTWHRQSPECDMEIIFNSPGGGVVAGMALWDHIQYIKSAGHRVTTSTVGYAASMAGVLLQAGDVRIMGKESWLLIHEGSFGAVGSVGEVEDTVEWVKRMTDRMVSLFAERSTMTKAQIKRKIHRTDWWIDSDEALKHGLVDEIR